MKKSAQLRRLAEAKLKAAGAIEMGEGGFTDEQMEEVKALQAEHDKLLSQAESMEKIEAAEAGAATALSAGGGRPNVPDVSLHERFEDDPNRGFKTPREFCLSVMAAGRGQKADERLRSLTVGSDEAATGDDPHGGFLVPEGFHPDLLQVGVEADPTGGLVTQIPMTAPTVSIPARVDKNHSSSVSGGLTVSRRAETAAAAASRMSMEQVKLEAEELTGLSYATDAMLMDSPISFAALLQAGFQDEFRSHLLDERLNGTGVGEFLGVMNSPCLVSVAKETDQTADTINFQNTTKMRSRCWGYGRAIWLYNQDALPQLMSMTDANGRLIWLGSAREDAPDLLHGRPAFPTEHCQTIGDKGDLILGNFTQYLEGTYQKLQSSESIHVRFVYSEKVFKFWVRNAGMPWWRTALTPKNSSNTLSPFVTLAARP